MQLKRFEEILNQIDENRYIFIEDLEKTNIIKKEFGLQCGRDSVNKEENPLSKFTIEQIREEIKLRESFLNMKKNSLVSVI